MLPRNLLVPGSLTELYEFLSENYRCSDVDALAFTVQSWRDIEARKLRKWLNRQPHGRAILKRIASGRDGQEEAIAKVLSEFTHEAESRRATRV